MYFFYSRVPLAFFPRYYHLKHEAWSLVKAIFISWLIAVRTAQYSPVMFCFGARSSYLVCFAEFRVHAASTRKQVLPCHLC